MPPTDPPPSDPEYDVEFFWDPICPFAWITSRWVADVAAQRGYRVDWRFISLRLINKNKDYATEFPPGYDEGHTAGLRALRVAAALRHELGRDVVGDFVSAYGHLYWDQPEGSDLRSVIGTRSHVATVLNAAGLREDFADAVDETGWDDLLDAESELALSRTGRDVGTPIVTFRPPHGPSFFGPVLSRVPSGEDSLDLWDAVTALARIEGFAELKRSLRERPRLRLLGGTDTEPTREDWQGGHRRGHLESDRSADG